MDIKLLKLSTKFGEMMFGKSVVGNQVIENFQQLWCNDAWKVC